MNTKDFKSLEYMKTYTVILNLHFSFIETILSSHRLLLLPSNFAYNPLLLSQLMLLLQWWQTE